jgi:hypothetical protein
MAKVDIVAALAESIHQFTVGQRRLRKALFSQTHHRENDPEACGGAAPNIILLSYVQF